ncbi:MotA/TolQ/ExbB proton channel family protein [Vibrio sp. PP-XX7]
MYYTEKNRSVEALELRLLEAVTDEQSHLEKGLSMLKLLAALAPMLGLLGTVTGMIETFQMITQFGNGDPKVMAGGISMALVTTVLGLVAAMPMLLAHNILSSQAESIRLILEKQGIAIVAEQAEKAEKESNSSEESSHFDMEQLTQYGRMGLIESSVFTFTSFYEPRWSGIVVACGCGLF